MLKNYAHRVTSSDLKYTTFKISGFFTNLATGKGSKEYDELKVTLANMGLSRDFVNAFADFNKAMNRYLDYPEISNTLLTLNIEQFEEDYNKIKDKNSEEFKDFAKVSCTQCKLATKKIYQKLMLMNKDVLKNKFRNSN